MLTNSDCKARLPRVVFCVLAAWTLGIVAPAAADSADGLNYSHSYALVVGINHYDAGWPPLSKPIEDAQAIRTALERLGFEVELRTDSSTEDLQSALLEFFVIKGADPDARLLLWYAGHGETIDGEGFLVPRDAPVSANPNFLLRAIPMRVVGSFVRLAQARHVLSVFDSCFSGTIFEARGAGTSAVLAQLREPVRQFLTSGDAGQPVRDDGSFREYFLRAITGEAEADFNHDGYVMGSELGLYMSQRISELTGAAQTPRYGKLHDVRFNRGDFVFRVGPPPEPTASLDKDGLFWQSIKWSQRAEEYRAYLQAFPNGTYARLARVRLTELAPRPRSQAATEELAVAALDETMEVAGRSPATVRGAPTADGPELTLLPPGTAVTVTGKALGGPWYRIRLPDRRTGFVLAAYLLPPEAAEAGLLPEKTLHVTFGAPINESVVIELDPRKAQIRRRYYLRNGSIAWFHGDLTPHELRFSIYVDSPKRTRGPAFRHTFTGDNGQSAVLHNISGTEYTWYGIPEEAYEKLTAAVDLTVTR